MNELRLALTPSGTLYAHAQAVPDGDQAACQALLSAHRLPLVEDWLAQGTGRATLLAKGLAAGWFQYVSRSLPSPELRLDVFIPHVILGLSGERKAALASFGGFCVAHCGFSAAEAQRWCVAAADHGAFIARQQRRGGLGISPMVSFHDDPVMLMPRISFIPFWVGGIDHCLVLGGEPLINGPAFVQLVWGLQVSATRFTRVGVSLA